MQKCVVATCETFFKSHYCWHKEIKDRLLRFKLFEQRRTSAINLLQKINKDCRGQQSTLNE